MQYVTVGVSTDAVLCNVTNDEGPQKNTPCVFPFRIKGTIYKECTNEKDPDNKFWCSTKVDENGEHIGGQENFGFCHEDCNFAVQSSTFGVSTNTVLCNVTNDEGPQKNKACVLPFRIKGTIYKECTSEKDPDNKFWCSTKVDENGEHIVGQGNFGFCHEDCNFGTIHFGSESSPTPNDRTANDENTWDFSVTPTKNFPRILTSKVTRRTTQPITITTIKIDTVKEDPNSLSFSGNDDTFTTRPLKSTTPDDTEYYDYYSYSNHYEEGAISDLQDDTSDGTWLPTPKKELCGEPTSAGYIVGGENSKGGEFPFMAALGRVTKNNTLFFICGGTLINRRYVVTAAHCYSLNSQSFLKISKVVLGVADLSVSNNRHLDFTTGGPHVFDVGPGNIIQHENFEPSRPEGKFTLFRCTDYN